MTEAYPFRRQRGFRSLVPESAWAELVRHGVCVPHHAKDELLRQGESGTGVMLSLSGRLKVSYAEPDGDEIVLALRGPGDLVGELSVQDGLPRSATVRAVERGATCRIQGRRFVELVQRIGLVSQLDYYISGKLRESAPHAWQLAHRTTASRLSALIFSIIEAAGPDHPSPTIVPMTQDELAAALGLVRSAVTPVLKEWKVTGLVRILRGGLEVVDFPMLVSRGVSSSGQNETASGGRLSPRQAGTSTEEYR
ncbi:Crp/Fnr family transcriptional regulator [Actinokineospora guangxiensis]|uniref:Crp/Fnr family transcriptional regulator n=1 Tax=Actinokineospora guangxiensis TaxID=1490288 RepID=A0ABW0ER99_9PSEU